MKKLILLFIAIPLLLNGQDRAIEIIESKDMKAQIYLSNQILGLDSGHGNSEIGLVLKEFENVRMLSDLTLNYTAIDTSGNGYFMLDRYGRFKGLNVFPGPFHEHRDRIDSTHILKWNKFWKVKKSDIESYYFNFLEAQALNVQLDKAEIPESILYWPARGNTHLKDDYDIDLAHRKYPYAPYIGVTGIYDPIASFCVPGLESIRISEVDDFQELIDRLPEEMLFYMSHSTSMYGGECLFVPSEHHNFVYSFNQEGLEKVLFFSNRIYLDKDLIEDFWVGGHVDFEIGCHYWNDLVGTEISEDLIYSYNAAPEDERVNAGDGPCKHIIEGEELPIIGIKILNKEGLHSHLSRVKIFPPPDHHTEECIPGFLALQGKWKDNTPITPKGNGYNPELDTVTTRYHFYDSPLEREGWNHLSWDSTGWNDATSNFGSFLEDPPNTDPYRFDFAIMVDLQAGHPRVDISDLIETGHMAANQYDSWVLLQDQVTSSLDPVKIFPNPLSKSDEVSWSSPTRISSIKITDVSGRIVHTERPESLMGTIDFDAPQGVYLISFESNTGHHDIQKLVVLK